MKSYNWNAQDYSTNSTFQSGLADELIKKLNLTGRENVLDIGCGDGKITARIASNLPFGAAVGIDSSEKMIELAGRTFNPESYRNLSFRLMDARQIDFPGKFDLVFSNAALHWIKDHKPVLQGIYNCLKPNGKMLIQMGGKGNAASIIDTIDTVVPKLGLKGYFKNFEFPYGFYSNHEYSAWLKEIGFEVERAELFTKDMSYADENGLAGWIRTTWLPYLERVPADMREKFIKEIVNIYCERYQPDSEGKIHVEMVRLEIEAHKPK